MLIEIIFCIYKLETIVRRNTGSICILIEVIKARISKYKSIVTSRESPFNFIEF